MPSLTRVRQTNAATIAHTWWVGEDAVSAGSVTATVKRLDGTAVAGSPFPAVDSGGTSTFTLPGTATTNLDTFTVDWTGTVAGTVRTERDYVEICGGFLFELHTLRTLPPALDARKYPTELLEHLRIETELEAERIARTTFVPRFKRVAVSGQGGQYLVVPHVDIRAVRAVMVDGAAWTSEQLARIDAADSGVLNLAGWWPEANPPGRRNMILEYEHGMDYCPADVTRAAIMRARVRVGLTDTTVPYRATSFTAVEGGIYRLATPSAERTGITEVDAAYLGHRQDWGGFA